MWPKDSTCSPRAFQNASCVSRMSAGGGGSSLFLCATGSQFHKRDRLSVWKMPPFPMAVSAPYDGPTLSGLAWTVLYNPVLAIKGYAHIPGKLFINKKKDEKKSDDSELRRDRTGGQKTCLAMVGSNPEGKQKPKNSQGSPDVSISDHSLSCATLQPTGLCSLFCRPWGTLGSSTGHLRKIKSPVQGQHCLSVCSLSAFPRQLNITPKSVGFEATRQHKMEDLFLKVFTDKLCSPLKR